MVVTLKRPLYHANNLHSTPLVSDPEAARWDTGRSRSSRLSERKTGPEQGRNSTSYYLHRDALGSITEVTNSSGSLVERYEYDVYSQPEFYVGSYNAITESAIGNPYLFTGRRYDPESGNYYYRGQLTRLNCPGNVPDTHYFYYEASASH